MKKVTMLTAALVVAVPAAVVAQNWNLPATYGEITLNSGFLPDPYVVQVDAGGNVIASGIGGSCTGWIAQAPDFQLTYTAGSFPLIIRTRSASDTTLAVHAADGRWYCDDDSGGDLNAQFLLRRPPSGVYDIWVGSFNREIVPAELVITELENRK